MSSEKRTSFTNNFAQEVLCIPDNTTAIELVKKDIEHIQKGIIEGARCCHWNSVVYLGEKARQKTEELWHLERQQDTYDTLIGAKL